MILKQCGIRDNDGHVALIALFRSDRAIEVNFNSDGFKLLFEKEKNMLDAQGMTVLMHLCTTNKHFLDTDLWFIPELLE